MDHRKGKKGDSHKEHKEHKRQNRESFFSVPSESFVANLQLALMAAERLWRSRPWILWFRYWVDSTSSADNTSTFTPV
jgi:hypothetical protein